MADISNSNLFINTGIPIKKDACIAIVKTEWNAEIVDALEQGCSNILKQNGIENIKVITVPGVVEIPFAIKKYLTHCKEKNNPLPDVFISLGCVIRGGTPHFDYVCKIVSEGILQLNLQLNMPVIFGVLTLKNMQQAYERIGGKYGHKGEEAAITALKMLNLESQF